MQRRTRKHLLIGGVLVAGVAVLAALYVAVPLALVTYYRHRNAQALTIRVPNGINETMYVKIGGIDQFMQIRGEDRNNPVLLVLHGGPGGSLWPLAMLFLPWEKYFTIVQWDQRGTGRTFERTHPPDGTMTIARMEKDGIEVTEFLRSHLNKEKIAVLGFSFGSILGIRMIRTRPDLYSAYVGTGQVVNLLKGYEIGYPYLLERARGAKDEEAVRELEGIAPFPTSDVARGAYRIFHKWLPVYEDDPDRRFEAQRGTLAMLSRLSPEATLSDVRAELAGLEFSRTALATEEITTTDLPALGLDFSIPIVFIEGEDDIITPPALSKPYLTSVSAPQKEFVSIPGGHFAFLSDPDRFLKELMIHVRSKLLPAVVLP